MVVRCICSILPASYRLLKATGLCCSYLSDDNVGLQIKYAYLQTVNTTKEQLKKPYPYSTTADIINKEVFSLHVRDKSYQFSDTHKFVIEFALLGMVASVFVYGYGCMCLP